MPEPARAAEKLSSHLFELEGLKILSELLMSVHMTCRRNYAVVYIENSTHDDRGSVMGAYCFPQPAFDSILKVTYMRRVAADTNLNVNKLNLRAAAK